MAALSVNDLWKGLSKAEIAEKRAKNAPRWVRRWREGTGRDARQAKQFYKEAQKAQADLDDASQRAHPEGDQDSSRFDHGSDVTGPPSRGEG